MSKTTLVHDPIHYIDSHPLSELKGRAPRKRLQRFCWNLEVVREQIPEGFNIKEADVCLSEENQGYISAKLDSSNKPRLHAVIRGLMQAQRIDRGAIGLFRDHVLYDNRGRAVDIKGNAREFEVRVPRSNELLAGLDIRTIYATGTPPLSAEEPYPQHSSLKSSTRGALACAVLGAVTTAAGVAAWIILRRRSEENEDGEESEEESEE